MGAFFLYFDLYDVKWLLKHLNVPTGTRLPEPISNQVIIPWGVDENLQMGNPALNPSASVFRLRDKNTMSLILELNGIQSKTEHRPTYKVVVFHLQALALFRTKVNPVNESAVFYTKLHWEEIEIDQYRYLHRSLVRLSIKAIYCLGLDFGEVTLETDERGTAIVIDVEPNPRLDKRLGGLFAESINHFNAKWSEELRRTSPVCLGTDLEFVICDENGKVKPASRFFGKKGTVGSDAVITRGHKIVYSTAELRPHPSTEPKQVFTNILNALRLASRKVSDRRLMWKAGGMPVSGVSLGGHIHLSQIWLNSFLLRALDNYLALPLILIEDESTKKRRPRYGVPGDFRIQSHGGFEYRTLPSWIVSPRAAKGVIALVSVIVNHYRQLTGNPLMDIEVQRYYYEGNKEKLLPVVKELWNEIEQTGTYEVYKHDLDPIKQQMMQMTSWREQHDLRISWHIPPFHR